MLSKKKLTVLGIVAVAVAALVLMWPLYPVAVKTKIIAATSATKWSEYQRLTKMLSLGMEPAEVQRILGAPTIADTLSIGQRWIYFEDESTAGWTCAVEFKREEEGTTGALKLCYVVNIEHVVFPDSERFEMGEKLNLKEPEGTIIFGLSNRPKRGGGTNN
jgi:outer membrane protein assembly factor BamE (lipoprotein component of BamABCDE complex)